MGMSTETAALLQVIKRDAEAIAAGRFTGGTARVVAGRIKGNADLLVECAESDKAAV